MGRELKSHDFNMEIENRFENMNLASSDVSDDYSNLGQNYQQ